MQMTTQNIERYLDHAVLKPEMTRDEAVEQMQLGIDYNVRTICVRPADIPLAVTDVARPAGATEAAICGVAVGATTEGAY